MYPSQLSTLVVLALAFAASAAPTQNPVFGRSAFPGGFLSRGALRRESPATAATKRFDDSAKFSKRSPVLPIPGVDPEDVDAGLTYDAFETVLGHGAVDPLELRAHHSHDMFHLH
ncbi:hypothetical protein PENSPDRAFT_683476 [Peniophora sp. CONT]|nr:hypothetical protein PENSPDRAFT_683476 [Peniophora sp. CONT]